METIKDRIVSALEMHALNNPDSNYEITFPQGDSYICRWENGEYSDNGEEVGTSEYDEWYELDYRVLKILKDGPNKNPSYDYIQVSKKHIPSLVTCNDEIIVSDDKIYAGTAL